MRYSRYLWGLALVLLFTLASAPRALAVTCGQPGSGGAEPTVGELELDTDSSSDPALPSFEGKTKTKDVAFIFKVSGCTLGSGSDVKARAVGDEADAVMFAPPEPEGDQLVIRGTAHPKKFDPGTHKPTVLVSSPSRLVKSQSLRLTLQRKQPWHLPAGLSVVGMAIGLFYAFELARQAAIDAYDKKEAEQANQQPPKKPGFVKLMM